MLTTGPQPIATERRVVWSNAVYTLAAAPEQDLTIYGTSWYPPEADGATILAWTSGASESSRLESVRPRRNRYGWRWRC